MSEPPDLRLAGGSEAPPDAPAPGDPERDDEDSKDAIERYILPYMLESTLWPVLVVIIVHVIAFVAPMMVFLVRDRSFVSGFGLLWLVFLTVQLARFETSRGRAVGVLNIVVVTTWILSVVAGFLAARADLI